MNEKCDARRIIISRNPQQLNGRDAIFHAHWAASAKRNILRPPTRVTCATHPTPPPPRREWRGGHPLSLNEPVVHEWRGCGDAPCTKTRDGTSWRHAPCRRRSPRPWRQHLSAPGTQVGQRAPEWVYLLMALSRLRVRTPGESNTNSLQFSFWQGPFIVAYHTYNTCSF